MARSQLVKFLVVVLAALAQHFVLVGSLLRLGATEALAIGLGPALPLAARLVLADLLEVDDFGHAFLMPRNVMMR